MNIDEMPAGREMDALVAEKVMGCKVEWIQFAPFCRCGYTCNYTHSPRDRDSQLSGTLHNYSTDIAAALMVFDKIESIEKVLRFTSTQEQQYLCHFSRHASLGATADTAPLAICRAALKAMDAH